MRHGLGQLSRRGKRVAVVMRAGTPSGGRIGDHHDEPDAWSGASLDRLAATTRSPQTLTAVIG